MGKYNYSTLLSTHYTRNAAVSCTSRPLHHFRDGIAICQVATKRANRRWARWGRTFNLSPSPRRTHHYKEQIGIQENVYHKDLTEVSQNGAFLSHIRHKFMLSQDACPRGEEHTKRKSRWLSVSVTAERCQPGRVSSGARRQRKKPTSYPLAVAPHWLNSPVFFSSSSQRGLLALWFLAFGSGETQKNHLLLNHP